MTEALPYRDSGAHFLAEARLQTFSENDPYQCALLLAAGIAEGDLEMTA